MKLTQKHYEKVEAEALRPGVVLLGSAFWAVANVAPPVAPSGAPLAAAVGCSAPLVEAGTAIAHQTEVASERHAAPLEGAACRSVPVADELWRRRESNPLSPRMDAGLQGDGTKGGTKNGADVVEEPTAAADRVDDAAHVAAAGDAAAVLVSELGALLRCLLKVGLRALPVRIRLDLGTLLARAVDNAGDDS